MYIPREANARPSATLAAEQAGNPGSHQLARRMPADKPETKLAETAAAVKETK